MGASASAGLAVAPETNVDVLIFDVDDMMYPLSSGFSDHRNGEVICKFMMEKLDFASEEEALDLRNEYFRKYHSTMKGLGIATEEGRLPNPEKPFREDELAQFWAEECDFAKYLKPDPAFIDALRSLRDDTKLSLVVFSNSPRPYVLQCLQHLGVREFFQDHLIFGVQEVLPACKPEREAFQKVLDAVGCTNPERAVMFEDSMKNIRACHQMGIKTVLINEQVYGGEAALLGDLPVPDDPAVGVVMNNPGQIRTMLPELWAEPSRFVTQRLAAVP